MVIFVTTPLRPRSEKPDMTSVSSSPKSHPTLRVDDGGTGHHGPPQVNGGLSREVLLPTTGDLADH